MISEAMTIVQAATPRAVELARTLFREYEVRRRGAWASGGAWPGP